MEPTPKADSLASNAIFSETNLHEGIRRRAEEIYVRNGRIPGRDVENWTEAEQEIWREAENSGHRTAIIVKVDGVQYVGEYRADVADGYMPGEFAPGSSVLVRFDGSRMLVKRPNGKILQTEVVQKIV